MPNAIELILKIHPDYIFDESYIKNSIRKKVDFQNFTYKVLKRSIDARGKQPFYVVKVQVEESLHSQSMQNDTFENKYVFKDVRNSPEVIIIGFGPAGMFAALECLLQGLKPVVFERGKKVRPRRRDLANITKNQIVNPDSNYCFGEGGAGTFSDGKLYTRSHKRGNVNKILELLVLHGASEDILIDAHPHIGTNKLPKVVEAIRETILHYGGEIHFESKLTDIFYENNTLTGIQINDENTVKCNHLVLATGHSARDIYRLLAKRNIVLEPKPFAVGVRAEHPQQLIDAAQYHCPVRHPNLPPASYKLVQQVKGLGVYSFCMCPGGIVAPCATEPGEIVTNGWSPSKRNNPFANSGIVVSVTDEMLVPLAEKYGVLAGVAFQEKIEKTAFALAGNDVENNFGQIAPAQRLSDFLRKKKSNNLPLVSYRPGVESVELHEVLPTEISVRLQEAFKIFGKKIKGYTSEEAMLIAPETRTSAPVRIPRKKETFEHIQIKGLYPSGEGAGYAGGIISAAIDGEKVVQAIAGQL
tara:strand:+ start:22365 stop:23948 length:1584 start_codon:yes stop_codon:yes gene_type:complete